jgi:hypothetical protein
MTPGSVEDRMTYTIEPLIEPGSCEAVIAAVNAFIERAYTPENVRLRKSYVYEYGLDMESFAFAVHCPGAPETKDLPGFALEELPDPLPAICRDVCDRMGLVRGRVLFNVGRYPEEAAPVPPHFDGELFEFEVKAGEGNRVTSGLRPPEVALLTLRNETEGCGTTLHPPDGRVIRTEARVGDLLRFDNLVHQHGVPETGRRVGRQGASARPRWIRYTIGWRALEQGCAFWRDGHPLRPLGVAEAAAVEERFLSETWPRLVDETVARGSFPFRSACT